MPTKLSASPLTPTDDWGPEKYGISVCISDDSVELPRADLPWVIDVEDDESGGFVGCGLYCGGDVYYFPKLSSRLDRFLESAQLIAHNGKSDLHKLRSWGVNVKSAQLVFDTMLASYVVNSTKESHGLKELSQSELQISYPAYRELVGSGRNRKTLAALPVELVSRYNAMDCIATHKLWQSYSRSFTPAERVYFETIEMPINRLLFDMEEKGITVSANYLADLDFRFNLEANKLLATLHRYCGTDFNPASPKQVSERLFGRIGVKETKTGKEILKRLESIPLVQSLIRYREVAKLRSTYTGPLKELALRDRASRIHTTFNQVAMTATGEWKGIRTGRLSSSEPNLHNIPTRTETGDMLRKAFVAVPGHIFVDADYSQIEWRLAAHFSGDRAMIQAINDGDPYKLVAAKSGLDRGTTKTAMLAANFGALGPKIAYVIGRTEKEGWKFLDAYQAAYPDYFKWRHKLERQDSVTTLFGRTIKPGNRNLNVPYMIQGSAADIIKKAMLACVAAGFEPLLQIHDELLFEVPQGLEAFGGISQKIKTLMESIIELKVPLVASVGIGATWQEAKG